MKELQKQISVWEEELKRHDVDPEVKKVFDNMSKYLIKQKHYNMI